MKCDVTIAQRFPKGVPWTTRGSFREFLMLELFKNETLRPFAYFTVLIFAWRVGNICIYLTLKPIFLILVCTSGHSVLYNSLQKQNKTKENHNASFISECP